MNINNLTADQAREMLDLFLKSQEEGTIYTDLTYEDITRQFSLLLTSKPRVDKEFLVNGYRIHYSDCFHYHMCKVVDLTDWFLIADIDTYRSELSWVPTFVRFESKGYLYVIDTDNYFIFKLQEVNLL